MKCADVLSDFCITQKEDASITSTERIFLGFLHPPFAPIGVVEPIVSSLSWNTPLTCSRSCIGKSASCARLVVYCSINCLHALAICVCKLLKIVAHWHVNLSHYVGCLKGSLAHCKCMQTSVRDLAEDMLHLSLLERALSQATQNWPFWGSCGLASFRLKCLEHILYLHMPFARVLPTPRAPTGMGKGDTCPPPLEMFKSVLCCICWLKPQ